MSVSAPVDLSEHVLTGNLERTYAIKLQSLAQKRFCKAGDTLFHEGVKVDGLYILQSGMLSISRVSIEGNRQLIGILGPGELAGGMALFCDHRHNASAQAIVDSTLGYFNRNRFFAFADQHPQLFSSLPEVVVSRLNRASLAFAQSQFLPMSGQVAAVLVKLAEHIADTDDTDIIAISYLITHKEIASMVGLARENVSRIINLFNREGLIDSTDGLFHIHDLARLKKTGRSVASTCGTAI